MSVSFQKAYAVTNPSEEATDMARPAYPVQRARKLLAEWLALRIPKAPHDAPITIAEAIKHLESHNIPTHRSTLHKKGLTALVADGAQRQLKEGGGRRSESERALYESALTRLREENEALQVRNRALLGQLALHEWNARRLNIVAEELEMAIPKPNRSASRAGRRRS